MGIRVTPIVCYGMDLGEESEWDQAFRDSVMGDERWFSSIAYGWDRAETPVEAVCYGYHEYPRWVLAVRGTVQEGESYEANEIALEKFGVSFTQTQSAIDFLKQLGIPLRPFKLFFLSYEG